MQEWLYAIQKLIDYIEESPNVAPIFFKPVLITSFSADKLKKM